MKKYKKYIIEKNGLNTEFQFFEGRDLPKNLPISTPLTFAFAGQNLVLTKKENGWWDILGGKIDKNESWKEALKRESEEEAGVFIDNISIVGYIIAKNTGNIKKTKFPIENILPVTISFVKTINKNWEKRETIARDVFKRTEAKIFLKERGDEGQLSEIFDYVVSYFDDQKYKYKFNYFRGESKKFDNVYTTQAMVFLRTKDNSFFIVRDFDEDFFSLPGGGCHLEENGEECAIREAKEEAQMDIKGLQLLGEVIVDICKNGVIMSRTKQLRYLAESDNISEFIPQKNGIEIIERKKISFDGLRKEVKLLKNKTGEDILSDLKSKI